MGLNYSQKKLLSMARHAKGNTERARRLRLYAFLTGILSLLITIVHFIVSVRM